MQTKSWVGLAAEGIGGCPFEDFLRGFPPAVQGRIVRKAEHVVEMISSGGVECLHRPRVDTLEGPIKEYQVTKQIRFFFSVIQEERIVLVLGGRVKKNGKIPQADIDKAIQFREEWLKTRRARKLELVLQTEKGNKS